MKAGSRPKPVGVVALLLLLLAPRSGAALEKPSPQELEQYRRDGTLPARVQQAYAGSCSYTTGTPIAVVTGARTEGIDFVLEPPLGTAFYTVAPCRALDSRLAGGAFGEGPPAGGEARELTLAGRCGIPASAKAVAMNVTATAATPRAQRDPGPRSSSSRPA
jgi:hypothetical protein